MTTTDRRDATDAQFADELARLDRLDVADVAADVRERAVDEALLWCLTVHLGMDEDEALDMAAELAGCVLDAVKPAPGIDTSTEDALHRVLDERASIARGICPRSNQPIMPGGSLRPSCLFCDCGESDTAGPQRDHDEEGGQ